MYDLVFFCFIVAATIGGGMLGWHLGSGVAAVLLMFYLGAFGLFFGFGVWIFLSYVSDNWRYWWIQYWCYWRVRSRVSVGLGVTPEQWMRFQARHEVKTKLYEKGYKSLFTERLVDDVLSFLKRSEPYLITIIPETIETIESYACGSSGCPPSWGCFGQCVSRRDNIIPAKAKICPAPINMSK